MMSRKGMEGYKSLIKPLLDDETLLKKHRQKISREMIQSARDLYELLAGKTHQKLSKSLPAQELPAEDLNINMNFKIGEKEISNNREKFAELQNVITICKGESSEEMKEFESLMSAYNFWQSSGQIYSRPQKSSEEPVRRGAKRSSGKRLSMTVRESRHIPETFFRNFQKVTPKPSKESEEFQKIKLENEKLRAQVDELTTRLSKIASDKLADGNPNFADLSDKNRPTKIGEKFGLVYDEEWSEAFEEIITRQHKDVEAYEILMKIVKVGIVFCQEVAKSQMSSIETGMREPMLRPQWCSNGKEYSVEEMEANTSFTASLKKFAKDFRKATSTSSISPLCTIFKDAKLKEIIDWDVYKMDNLNIYIDACIECLWLMCVQDPPMHIVSLNKGDTYNPACFNMFMTKGKEVEYTVWPAVFLYKDGPLISKGYVKVK
ncbi:uncharacterized protein LOC133192359 [Saccostrea echinata]|uniref:uncharacterized protein LOC133192359 n=1 Tax=Saccostrea echinata TaxID=191078 RepID=UPI002A82D3B1|nr:uncharacterized protein LOC133192359 [Saccostrea echinata]